MDPARLPRRGRPPRFDVLGFVLAGGGLAAVLFALTRAPDRGWESGHVLVPPLCGTMLLVVLVPWELRAEHPMIDLRIVEDQLFRTTQMSLLPMGAAFLGVLYLYPQFLQDGLGFDAFRSGLATFPEALGMLAASQVVSRLHDRVGPRRLMVTGGAGAAVIAVYLATAADGSPSLALYPSMFLLGCCVGLLFASGQNAAFVTVPASRMSDATTVLNMQRQLAAAFGVALAGTLVRAGSGAGYRVGFLTMAAVSLCACLLALRVSDRRVREGYASPVS
ncbi:MFS transporter [Streptomyces sp. NPDC060002]|uniref:MFS transporter n=1 Tax=Streptomyces sp. NPDC060002 TaxID=3347033 RepID=UPI00368A9BEF